MSTGGGNTSGVVRGLALRDALASDYARNFRRLGWSVDMAYLERLAAQDLELVEAHERDDAPPPPPRTVEAAPPRTTARDAIEARGMELRTGDDAPKQWRSLVLDAPPALLGPRFHACANRIAQIYAGGSGDRRAAFKRGGWDAMLDDTEVPALAREVYDLFVHFTALRHRRSKWNPFLDLSPKDAARVLIRRLEDIADRSTAVLGPWWVK